MNGNLKTLYQLQQLFCVKFHMRAIAFSELEGTGKKIMAYFNLLSEHASGVTHEALSQDSWCTNQI
jgi:hypothetical protein